MSEEAKFFQDLYRWPQKWMMLDEDLDYGRQLVEEVRPFIVFLMGEGYTKKTIKKHCDNLCEAALAGFGGPRYRWSTLRCRVA